MSLDCAPKPPPSLCHVHVFCTRPLLLRIKLASLTANTALSAVSTMSGGIWGEKKGENLNADAGRCLI